MQNKFDLALSLLNAGYSVIPVSNKVPVGKWKKFQKDFPIVEDLNNWFIENNYDIGIVTGSLSGLTIIDVDLDGLDSDLVKEFEKKQYPYFKTKRGGRHYWFQYSDKIYTQAPIKGFKGIDCRNDGGQAVFYGDCFVNQNELPDFPDSLFPVQEELGTKTDWEEVFKYRGSGRNDALCTMAGKLLSTIPPHEWESVGWPLFRSYDMEYNEPSIIEEWGEADLRKKWDGIASRELEKRTNCIPEPSENPNGQDNADLELVSFNDLITSDIKETEWLVKDLIPLNGITALFGDEDAGKTFMYLDLVCKIANGGLFLDLFETKRTRSLVVDLENRKDVLGHRLYMQGIRKLDLPPYLIGNRNLTLSDYYTDRIIQLCKEKDIGLVVIDSLSALLTGDETKSEVALSINKQLVKLKFANLTVLLIAHPPKKQQYAASPKDRTISGSHHFSKQLDASWYLENQGSTSLMHCRKLRVAKKPDQPIKVYIQSDGKSYYRLTGTEGSLAGFATNEQITQLIKKSLIIGPWNKEELIASVVNALNTTRQQAYTVLNSLIETKAIVIDEKQVSLPS